MPTHPLLEHLDLALRDLMPGDPVDFAGAWSHATRRAYKSEAQLGSGSGPFADVIDAQWRGSVTAAAPIGAMAFLLANETLHWSKAPEIATALAVDISLHAFADFETGRATFAATVAGAYLPGVPVSAGRDLATACSVASGTLRTGRVACLAEAGGAAFFVLLLPRDLLKVGRKRLWRIRDDIAASLTADAARLLSRRRTGSVPALAPAPPPS